MLVFSSGTSSSGNSGALLVGSGGALDGRGGLVSVTAGSRATAGLAVRR